MAAGGCKSVVTKRKFAHLIELLSPAGSLHLRCISKMDQIMAKPILLSVDDDPDVLRAIERDLRSQYGADYRVIGSDSPDGALSILKQLKVRNDSVALLLADQRMPHMDGVAFLAGGNAHLSRSMKPGAADGLRRHQRRNRRHQ